MNTYNTILINEKDNVRVASEPIKALSICDGIRLLDDIPAGHKFATKHIRCGENIIKYGHSIGLATKDIMLGQHIHTHNVKSNLSEYENYEYIPTSISTGSKKLTFFNGYKREDGKVGIRNEIWILPIVGCVNDVCKQLEEFSAPLLKKYCLDGIYHFSHPYGCSQLGDDMTDTTNILAGLCRHPNAGGVLVVALGCENITLDLFKAAVGKGYDEKIRYLVCQNEKDEISTGLKLLEELAVFASSFSREKICTSELVIGLKCGGSDGFSGITANPVVGEFSDKLTLNGGTPVLTEIPEVFGAEHELLNRSINSTVFEKGAAMINSFKAYFLSHNQPVGENPSPGNKAGGITTLEEKSLGCVQKGGKSSVVDFIKYGDVVHHHGLNVLYAPGNDLVSSTALTAAGAVLILFTTGRGTPFSAPAPTVKISTTTDLFERKNNWIDFDAGTVLHGDSIHSCGQELYDFVLCVANGQRTKSEQNNQRGIAIWKNGVTL